MKKMRVSFCSSLCAYVGYYKGMPVYAHYSEVRVWNKLHEIHQERRYDI